jgi:hypothetical protein
MGLLGCGDAQGGINVGEAEVAIPAPSTRSIRLRSLVSQQFSCKLSDPQRGSASLRIDPHVAVFFFCA